MPSDTSTLPLGACLARRLVGIGLVAWLAIAPPLARAFGFEDVAAIAKRSSAQAFRPVVPNLPPELKELDYDASRDIRFKPERAIWRNDKLPFELMFFHVNRGVQEPVRINIVDAAGTRGLPFDPSAFNYGRNKIDLRKAAGIGFAGFRVHYALNNPKYKDEVLVFMGASYFRALGKGQSYGLSARGLAVDTASASGEEFPRFVEFWVEKPKPRAPSMVIYGLLDSKRVAGAYRFVVTPGVDTVMQVTARLYLRDTIQKLGIAPLTSMFAFGENQPGRDDYRPEVHDSDGLLLHTGENEWIWRPLVNPKRLLITSFATTNPAGFGLLQRDRAVGSYEDPEALYERRPSVWVEPTGTWGAGRVELVTIPSPDETNDNIVSYWVNAKPATKDTPIDLAYKLHWQMPGTPPGGLAAVVQTRRGRGYTHEQNGDLQFVIDFDGANLRALPTDAKLNAAVATDSNAELHENNLFRNHVTGAWRMTVRFKRLDAAKPVELRAIVKQKQAVMSETWSYIVPPETDKP